jgi:uncharacterized protein YcfL
MKRNILLLTTALMLLAVVGCESMNTVDVAADGSYNWIKGDSVLKNVARVKSANKEMQDGLLHVQIVIHNKYKTEGTFKYRFDWINGNGMMVHTPLSTWEQQTIHGKQTMTLDGVAPDPSITDCRVEMFLVD